MSHFSCFGCEVRQGARFEAMAAEAGEEISQWAKEVVDFSSQYGSETSISYTVSNISGPSSIYPTYGDFTQSCVLRMYGPWWKMAPSAPEVFKRTPKSFVSEDYIDLWFEYKVFPSQLEIYETYIPGAVVRILACDTTPGESRNDIPTEVRWTALWAGGPEAAPEKSRIFCPPIRKIPFATNLIRLELNSSLCQYYTEIDAVCIRGLKAANQLSPQHLTEDTLNNTVQSLRSLQINDAHLNDRQANLKPTNNGFFGHLPEEVIQLILQHLDTASLCNAALTCNLFYTHCYDPLQYTEMDLQPYWSQVNDIALDSLHERCRHLQRLNLSWCGSYNLITKDAFSRFIQVCSSELTCLRLACCKFVNNEVIKLIGNSCSNLTELDVHCCRRIDGLGFIHLSKLTRLRKLNFYRTMIDLHSLCVVIRSCQDLEELNVGACIGVNNFNEVAAELGNNCRKLRCLDCWRSRTLSGSGLMCLINNCPYLEELDLGWCSDLRSGQGCFRELAQKCIYLKKLFLTANRTVNDADLESIAKHCPLLEQLDILGTREVSQNAALMILNSCKKLKLFDISFCAGIDFVTVYNWRKQYPNVDIKKSFQN